MLRLLRGNILPICRSQLTAGQIQLDHLNSKRIRWHSTEFDIDTWVDTLDEAQQKRIRFIQNELTLQRIDDRNVPQLSEVTKDDFEHILSLSNNQRQKYYSYLYKVHHSQHQEQIRRAIRIRINDEKHQEQNDSTEDKPKHIEYSLGKNTIIPKIYNRTIDKWKNSKAFSRILLNEPKLIFDCGFSSDMTVRENADAAKQLMLCFALNRNHRTPFVLHFANIDFQSTLWKSVQKCMPTLTHKHLPIQLHEQDSFEVFPKEKIVFLTPDSPNMLHEYNPDDCYVISGLVDRGDKIPFTMAKAKKFDLRTARLPMDSFRTCRVNRTLSLDQVMQVMLEIKFSGDWNQAFRYVAARKFI